MRESGKKARDIRPGRREREGKPSAARPFGRRTWDFGVKAPIRRRGNGRRRGCGPGGSRLRRTGAGGVDTGGQRAKGARGRARIVRTIRALPLVLPTFSGPSAKTKSATGLGAVFGGTQQSGVSERIRLRLRAPARPDTGPSQASSTIMGFVRWQRRSAPSVF